jgi:hypothetical protein
VISWAKIYVYIILHAYKLLVLVPSTCWRDIEADVISVVSNRLCIIALLSLYVGKGGYVLIK